MTGPQTEMAGSHPPSDDQPVERLADLRARALAVLRDAAVLAVAAAGEDTLRAILAGEGDDAFVMAVAARDLPPPRSERVSEMILAARRTAAFKRDLLARAGGVLTTAQVRERLGWRSDRAVLRAAGTVRSFVCGRAVEHYAAMARTKRSPKMTANWAFAMFHSRGGIFHSFSDRFKIR